MEEILNTIRAKSKDGKGYLLVEHIEESLKRVAEFKRFIDKNRDVIRYKNYTEDFFKSLIIACLLHDLGKINPYFQKRVFSKEERETEKFKKLKTFFGNYKDIEIKDHEVISALLSIIFIDNCDWDKIIRTSILLHHYNDFYLNTIPHIRYLFDNYPDLEKYVDFLISKEKEIENLFREMIRRLRNDLGNSGEQIIVDTLDLLSKMINMKRIDDLKKRLEKSHSISDVVKFFEIPDKENEKFYDFFVFLGTLRRCDYSASSCIEIEMPINLRNTVYNLLEDKIEERIKSMDGEFWQKSIIDKYRNVDGELKNLVLVAPTGAGKTEFALLWAKSRGKKMLYTLPLRAALNDLYHRFCEEENKYFDEKHLAILHSTSFIEYMKERVDGSQVDVEIKEVISRLFSLPIVLSTPDQVFLSSLKYYGFDKLVSIYPLSLIVVDEIHAYTPEMTAIILKTLKIIEKLEGDILIITATFPPYLREFINESKGFKIIDIKDEDMRNKVKNYNIKRHRIRLLKDKIFSYKEDEGGINVEVNEKALEKIRKIINKSESKNILIIVNNVGKSIELFKRLESLIENKKINVKHENLYLLHSRLLEKEKKKRITEMKEKMKRQKEEGNVERIVLVATQIVEASVDIDFDILITEISPIDSQIQRWGRVYRNRNTSYSENQPNVYIFADIKNDKGTLAIYERESIEKTIEVLSENVEDSCLGYEDERKLIDEVFEKEVELNGKRLKLKEKYVERIKENLEWLEYVSVERMSEAQRIFRRIAGLQFVFPSLMVEYGENNIEKEFGKIIDETISRNEKKVTWSEIIERIRNKLTDEKDKQEVNEFELKKILYLYSINLPVFLITDNANLQLKNEFKGFFVITPEEIGERSEVIKKYGISKIKRVDLDLIDIEEFVI